MDAKGDIGYLGSRDISQQELWASGPITASQLEDGGLISHELSKVGTVNLHRTAQFTTNPFAQPYTLVQALVSTH